MGQIISTKKCAWAVMNLTWNVLNKKESKRCSKYRFIISIYIIFGQSFKDI